jgi:translation initiation factor IF-3
VKVSVRLRGRENAHPELGRQLLDKIIEALKHAAVVERPPIMEARIISMILSKAPGWEPQKVAASGTHARKGAKSETTPAATPEAATDAPPAETPDAEQTPSTPS